MIDYKNWTLGDHTAIIAGHRDYRRRRNAAWSFMLESAARQHSCSHPLTAKTMQTATYGRIYGCGHRELAAMLGVKAKTIRTLRHILGLLVAIAESGGSPLDEVFSRFGSFDLADKRTRNTRTTYRPRHRKDS